MRDRTVKDLFPFDLHLWSDENLYPSILGTAFFGFIAGNGLIEGAAYGLHIRGIEAVLFLKIPDHRCSPCRREFPIGRKFVFVIRTDGNVVSMSGNPDLFPLDIFEYSPNFF